MIIEKIITFPNGSLAIFYTRSRGWQYSILLSNGNVLSPPKIYYTKEAAESAGRDAIRKVLDK